MTAALHPTIYHWIGFNLAIAALLGMELIRFARNPRPISVTESLISSSGWIALSLLFNGWIYWTFGQESALDFLTGYIIEKSLSVDNLFLFLILFAHFKVPEEAKHKVLFYGIIGAIAMRALLIWGGIAAVEHFEWALQVFGLFLVITGVRFAFDNEKKEELKEKAFFRFLKKHLPFTDQFHGNAFFSRARLPPFSPPSF